LNEQVKQPDNLAFDNPNPNGFLTWMHMLTAGVLPARRGKSFQITWFKVQGSRFKVDGTVKSLISDGAVKSSRSRLAQFRRMQRTYPYVKF